MTQALILAAGVGRRLGRGELPKATLELGGRSLMERHISSLRRHGIDRITVVAGFAAEAMRAVLAPLGAVSVLINPDFREGSVVSLHVGAAVMRSGDPVILMDADVLYDDRLMARLVGSARPDSLLLDRDIEPGDEPVKLCIAGDRIADFRKRPTEPFDWFGESVGFFRFTAATAAELADRAADYVTAGRRDQEYEEPIRDMLLADPSRFGWEDITGLPWTEIDFPEDIDKARSLLPELSS